MGAKGIFPPKFSSISQRRVFWDPTRGLRRGHVPRDITPEKNHLASVAMNQCLGPTHREPRDLQQRCRLATLSMFSSLGVKAEGSLALTVSARICSFCQKTCIYLLFWETLTHEELLRLPAGMSYQTALWCVLCGEGSQEGWIVVCDVCGGDRCEQCRVG